MTGAVSVPLLSAVRLQQGDRAELQRLDAACREYGFFQLTEHGIAASARAMLLTTTQEFFSQPYTEKCQIARTAQNTWGYYAHERTKNQIDCKEIFDVGPTAGHNVAQWPQWPENFRSLVEEYSGLMTLLAHRLLRAISQALGLDPSTYAQDFSNHTSFLRLNYYPSAQERLPQNYGDLPLGIHHHTDAGALTILLQDQQQGLQMRWNNQWLNVEPLVGAFTINIGDIVQVWSNDRYQAPVHRVTASAATPRYSAPYFFNPNVTASYAPHPQLLTHGAAARYRPICWGDFRAARAAGDYADYGAEIQISDFAISTAAT